MLLLGYDTKKIAAETNIFSGRGSIIFVQPCAVQSWKTAFQKIHVREALFGNSRERVHWMIVVVLLVCFDLSHDMTEEFQRLFHVVQVAECRKRRKAQRQGRKWK
jgi:hypothetical protein